MKYIYQYKIIICGNSQSKDIQLKLSEYFSRLNYDVEIYDPCNDFVLNLYKLFTNKIIFFKNTISIILANDSESIASIITNYHQVKNIFINNSIPSIASLENVNSITFGIQKLTFDQILTISNFCIKHIINQ